jgi:hypothetical protein
MKKILVSVAILGLAVWLFWPDAPTSVLRPVTQAAPSRIHAAAKDKPDAFMQDMKEEDDPAKLIQNANDATEDISQNQADDSAKPIAFVQSVTRFIEQLNARVQGKPEVRFHQVKDRGEFNNIPVELWQFSSELSNHDDGLDTVVWFLAKRSGNAFYAAKIMEIGGSSKHVDNAIKQMANDEASLYSAVINDPSNLVSFVNQIRVADGQPSSVRISTRIVANLLSQAHDAIRDGDETRRMTVRDHGIRFSCLIGNVGGFTLHKAVIAIKAEKTHLITIESLQN